MTGRNEFDSKFEEIRGEFDLTEKDMLDHVYAHALNFIFDIDPQAEKIERIKKDV